MSKRLPRVALIGRPNVGKSTLFNRLIGRRRAIVEDTPGVTRDRHYGQTDWLGYDMDVIDTGGLEPRSDDTMLSAMRRQTLYAVEESDVVMMIVDGRDGLMPQDQEIINELRATQKPFLVGVNKIDNFEMEGLIAEFYAMGVDNLTPISAMHGAGVGDLMDELVFALKRVVPELFVEEEEEEEETDRVPHIAIIGKPNAGKSTLVNHLIGEERVLALPIAGTTRDSIDVDVTYNDQPYKLIDTAGIRRQKYVKETLEKLTISKALKSIDRCDVAVFMVDATVGLTEQDAKVVGFAHNKGRAIVLLVNKWDQMPRGQKAMKEFEEHVRYELKFLHYAPIVFASALTGRNISRLFKTIDELLESFHKRVPTGELNRFFDEMMRYHPPPVHRGRPIKFYYISQVATGPPTFMISANQPKAAHITYQRFIINSIRGTFGFEGVPIKLVFRQRGKREE